MASGRSALPNLSGILEALWEEKVTLKMHSSVADAIETQKTHQGERKSFEVFRVGDVNMWTRFTWQFNGETLKQQHVSSLKHPPTVYLHPS